MKRIVEYRKLLGVDKTADLKALKTVYRTFMKDWHPDKFQNEDEKLHAEAKSKTLIEAYHFLVSVAPETIEAAKEEYTAFITASRIRDFIFKSQNLTINFLDGNVYEYIGVPHNVYNKFLNSDSPDRFARRHIYHSYIYRQVSKAMVAA